MGNRAVITNKDKEIGVYLHWNGGRDSVEAFLKYCEIAGFRSLTEDPAYGFARLTQVITNWFGGGLSCGVNILKKLDCDNFDNGMYIVDGWQIVGREYYDGPEQQEYDLLDMLLDIDSKQSQHIGEEEIKKYLKEHPVVKEEKKEEEPDPVPGAVESRGHTIVKKENGYDIELVKAPNDRTYFIHITDKHNVVSELENAYRSFDEDEYVKEHLCAHFGHPPVRDLLEDAEYFVKELEEMIIDVSKAIKSFNKR